MPTRIVAHDFAIQRSAVSELRWQGLNENRLILVILDILRMLTFQVKDSFHQVPLKLKPWLEASKILDKCG